jgi:hypothetical protein
MGDPSYEKRYEAARERVKQLKDFYTHLVVYVAVILLLVAIDWLEGDRALTWAYWPALGWGVAVVIHAAHTFVLEGIWGPDWEERKAAELLGEKPKRKGLGPMADPYQNERAYYAEPGLVADDDELPLPVTDSTARAAAQGEGTDDR